MCNKTELKAAYEAYMAFATLPNETRDTIDPSFGHENTLADNLVVEYIAYTGEVDILDDFMDVVDEVKLLIK